MVKVPGLDGTGKMSKSENQLATLYLSDDDELIRKKVMKAKTDNGPTEPNSPKPDYIRNNEQYLKEVMEKGAEKARKSAKATMELVRQAMGLNYFAPNP